MLAARERRRQVVRGPGQPDKLERVGVEEYGVAVAARAHDGHVVRHSEVPQRMGNLERAIQTESTEVVRGFAAHVVSLQRDGAPAGLVDAGYHIDEGGLAGTVWTYEAECPASEGVQIHSHDGHESGEGLREAPHLKKRSTRLVGLQVRRERRGRDVGARRRRVFSRAVQESFREARGPFAIRHQRRSPHRDGQFRHVGRRRTSARVSGPRWSTKSWRARGADRLPSTTSVGSPDGPPAS